MALIKFSDGRTAYTDYNTAAKIYQILKGNEMACDKEERPRLMKIAEQTESIDFAKYNKEKK